MSRKRKPIANYFKPEFEEDHSSDNDEIKFVKPIEGKVIIINSDSSSEDSVFEKKPKQFIISKPLKQKSDSDILSPIISSQPAESITRSQSIPKIDSKKSVSPAAKLVKSSLNDSPAKNKRKSNSSPSIIKVQETFSKTVPKLASTKIVSEIESSTENMKDVKQTDSITKSKVIEESKSNQKSLEATTKTLQPITETKQSLPKPTTGKSNMGLDQKAKILPKVLPQSSSLLASMPKRRIGLSKYSIKSDLLQPKN